VVGGKVRRIGAALLVALLTVLIYLPVLGNDFVNWDDPEYVYDNEQIRTLGKESLWWMFTAYHASNWHPLTWLSHGIDYAMWGLNPMGHHLTSVLLHGLNTLLVVVVISSLVGFGRGGEEQGRAVVAGAVTGLLFGVHPLHVESVAWVSERKDVLYAVFYLLSILFYIKYVFFLQREGKERKESGLRAEQADGGDAAGGAADTGRVSLWAYRGEGFVYESVAAPGGEGTLFRVEYCLVSPDAPGPGGIWGNNTSSISPFYQQGAHVNPCARILSLKDGMAR
jgi:hypothetical protein